MPAVATNTDVPLTEMLVAWRAGDGAAFSSLIDATYQQLKDMAAGRLKSASGSGMIVTLTPQELLHEAVAGVMESTPTLKNRSHFFATMSLLMRTIIVDFARERMADKRGGGQANVTFTESLMGEQSMIYDILALDAALIRLAETEPRCSSALHLTYFAGMKQSEIAALLEVSLPTLERDLRFARAWLEHEMSDTK